MATQQSNCPLVAVDRRLADAHRLWHQAERSYFDPDEFRLASQSLIQTLRTVTFILQKNKAVIPNFDAWYDLWTQKFAVHEVMQWAKEARNVIEKQGDLESRSIVRATIIASYMDGPGLDLDACLSEGLSTLLARIPLIARQHVNENGSIRIERRWVANSLPNYELLDALSVAYGALSQLVNDAHKQANLAIHRTVACTSSQHIDFEDLDGRPPCMISHHERRTAFLSLKTGKFVEMEKRPLISRRKVTRAARRRYDDPKKFLKAKYASAQDMAVDYFNMARHVFLKDGFHATLALLCRNNVPVTHVQLLPADRQQKYLMMRSLGVEVARVGADAVMLIGESWIAPPEKVGEWQFPVDVPDRGEALTLTLVTKEAEPVDFEAVIHREGSTVHLDDTKIGKGAAVYAFMPIYQVWKKPIPLEWLAPDGTPSTEQVKERPHKPPPQFSPARNAPCLCGSGLRYKRCCAERLPGTEHISTRTRTLLTEGKYKDALYASRADVTQYTIWHKSHTEPAVRAGMPKVGTLFEVDVNALSDFVETLLQCHIKMDMMGDFPAVLERLRDNIKDDTWQRKIIYLRALHALWPDWDESAGRRELKKLGSIAEEKDVKILQLYLDVFDDELDSSKKEALIDRILSLTKDPVDRIHYMGSKAVLHLIIGDRQRTEAELAQIVDEVRSEHDGESLGNYGQYRFALTLGLLGSLRQDDNLLTEALNIYQKLYKDSPGSPSGRAHLLKLIGDTYRDKGEWELAQSSYAQAFDLVPSAIFKVFLSESLLHLNKLKEATATLAEVSLADLDASERVDYAFALASLAIETGERDLLKKAKDGLMAVQPQERYFSERRRALLLDVEEALAHGPSQILIRRTRRFFSDIARSASSYMKPKFRAIRGGGQVSGGSKEPTAEVNTQPSDHKTHSLTSPHE